MKNNSEMPLVSIIVPCFNAETFVSESIESALQQTYANVEVVAVDDGSTDGTLGRLQSFGDRIKVLSGPNVGGCAARNKGIKAASGQLVQFLDADDLLNPQKLELQVPVLLANLSNVVYCDVDVVDFESGELLEVYKPRSESMFRRVCFDPIQTAAPLHYKSDLLEVGGFREGMPCSQEKDLHVRLACSGNTFEHIPGSLVTYRKRADSVSGNYQRVMEQYCTIVGSGAEMLNALDETKAERLKILAELLVWAGRQLWRIGAYESAIEKMSQARQLHPSRGLGGCSLSMRILHRTLGSRIAFQLKSMLTGQGKG